MRGQSGVLLNYLLAGNRITSAEAFERFGVTRLSARIYEYKAKGYPILDRKITEKNRYGESVTYSEYWIHEDFLKDIRENPEKTLAELMFEKIQREAEK